MTQEAVVTKVFANGTAEVAVTRGTACGGTCGSCEACKFQEEIKSIAANRVQATQGQRVMIESRNSAVFKAAALVYIMPMILFLAGYIIASVCGAKEGICVLTSFLGLCLGAALMVFSQRRKHGNTGITFDIIQTLE